MTDAQDTREENTSQTPDLLWQVPTLVSQSSLNPIEQTGTRVCKGDSWLQEGQGNAGKRGRVSPVGPRAPRPRAVRAVGRPAVGMPLVSALLVKGKNAVKNFIFEIPVPRDPPARTHILAADRSAWRPAWSEGHRFCRLIDLHRIDTTPAGACALPRS